MSESPGRFARSHLAELDQAGEALRPPPPAGIALGDAFRDHKSTHPSAQAMALLRAMRPAQWVKNGLVFAGLIFGGKLLQPDAVANAVLAAILFSLLSSGFYLLNDVRDVHADRLHPEKRTRPIAAGVLAARTAVAFGCGLVVLALIGAARLNSGFFLAALAYAALMASYNLGLKQIVIVDVFAIAIGFVLRAAAGAIAVDVSFSPWLLLCTMMLALLVGFGKRRHELLVLEDAGRHRHNLNVYSSAMLDQSVAVTAAATLIAYSVYTFGSETAPFDHRMMLTIPVVAYGIFRYLFLLYHRDQGGAPETMLVTDRALLLSVIGWGVVSTVLFYLTR